MRFLPARIVLPMLLLCGAAFADLNPLITVDEYGVGVLDFTAAGAIVTPLAGVLQADPGPGGLSSTLTYNLLGPPALTAGDVRLHDADFGGAFLDVIRFNPAGTGGAGYPASLVFYSDNVDGADAPADTTGPPLAFYTNVVDIPEVGPEGNNGAIYTPTVGQPGFVPGFSVTYHFISDGHTSAVPEPSSLVLCGAAAVLMYGRLRNRRILRPTRHVLKF